MTTDETRLLSAHVSAPHLRDSEGTASPLVDRANAALEAYLGESPLTGDILAEVVEAGCRSLSRQDADATVLALQDTRAAMTEERDALRRELEAAKSTMTAEVSAVAARVAEHSSTMMGTMSARVTEIMSGVPSDLKTTIGPQLELLLQQFGSGLLAASNQMLDVNNPHSATYGLALQVTRAVSDHADKVSTRLGELEMRLGVADARAEEREKSSAKGFDFEDELEAALGVFAESSGMVLAPTGLEEGLVRKSKKGDFVFRRSDGSSLVGIEAKNKTTRTSVAEMHRYLDELQRNRDTPVAVWVTNGVEQNEGKLLRFLSDTRWAVAFDEEIPEVLLAVLKFASITAARLRDGGADASGDIESARAKVSEALTAAEDLGQVQKLAADMVTNANTLSAKVIAVRSRVSSALLSATAALSGDTSSDGV